MNDSIRMLDHPLFKALRNENVETFNEARKRLETVPDFSFCDFRGLDLRGLVADGLDFSNSYFRGSDLRGIDFRQCNLEGASIAGSKISGCYFPQNLAADELIMSLNHGTRMRYRG